MQQESADHRDHLDHRDLRRQEPAEFASEPVPERPSMMRPALQHRGHTQVPVHFACE